MQSLSHTLRLCALGTLLLPILAGCGGGGGGGNGNSGGSGTNNGGNNNPVSVSVVEANGLTASLTETTNTVAVGGTVTYTLALTNNTSAAIVTNAFSARDLPANFRVFNSAGTTVYAPLPYAPQLNTISVAPGQSVTATQTVATFPTAGVYNATATFADTLSNVSVGPLTVTAQ